MADTPTRRLHPICRTVSLNINIGDVVHIENFVISICLLKLRKEPWLMVGTTTHEACLPCIPVQSILPYVNQTETFAASDI